VLFEQFSFVESIESFRLLLFGNEYLFHFSSRSNWIYSSLFSLVEELLIISMSFKIPKLLSIILASRIDIFFEGISISGTKLWKVGSDAFLEMKEIF